MAERSIPCNNFMLCASLRFAELVERKLAEALERNVRLDDALKEVKKEFPEALMNAHIVSVDNVCSSLDRVSSIYYEPLVEGFKNLGYCIVDVEASLSEHSRLLVGASGGMLQAMFEVGLTWDYILDLPFIPASSIKGAIRSWLITRMLEAKSETEERRDCLESILALTGVSPQPFHREELKYVVEKLGGQVDAEHSEASGGLIIVGDAYPVGKGRGRTGCGLLDYDVITPHYYRGGKPIEDEFEAQPVPVSHLVIAPGTRFKFVIAVERLNRDLLDKIADCIGLKEVADECKLLSFILLSTLTEGIGARTTKGYGMFEFRSARILSRSRAALSRHRPGRLSWRLQKT